MCGDRYLPAAHILELTVEMVLFSMGGALGYADPRSISSNGAVRRTPTGEINDQPVYPYPPGAIQVRVVTLIYPCCPIIVFIVVVTTFL